MNTIAKRIYTKNVLFECDKDLLTITLNKNSSIIYNDFDAIIKRFNPRKIAINNIVCVRVLDELIKTLKNLYFNGEIMVYLNYTMGNHSIKNNMIEGLENRTRLDLSGLSANVTINAFYSDSKQTEFTTWAHNLNDDAKQRLYYCLDENSRKAFYTQEKIIKEVTSKILELNEDFYDHTKKEQFEIVFDYINKNYPLATDCMGSYNTIRYDALWATDAVKTYERGRGVSIGRSNLLTLVCNNSIFRLNCYTVYGHRNNVQHAWNQFIDKDEVLNYDLSYSIKGYTNDQIKNCAYKSERVYSIIDSLNKKKKNKKLIKVMGR